MRLNRLDLTRYGRFSDAQIVLPAPKGDAADVTVIYGANEAGKSTAFTAYLELLFGMKSRDHPYEFRFKRSDLLVGAELDLPNHGPVVLQRNSKKNGSLTDDQGRPVEDTFLTAALHGLTRDAYVERFSLNDDGLRRGGARIAGAQGDLGQLLHAGVSGLTGMATTLDQMSTRADQFHKKGARATVLKTGKDRMVEIERELRATQLTPEREGVLRAANDTAQRAFEAANDELSTARLREAAFKAAQIWYDRTGDIETLDAALTDFPDGPDLGKGAAEAVASLVTTLSEKSERIGEADQTIATLESLVADNPVDPVADAITTELTHLDQLTIDGASLMARATTATFDLDKRCADRDLLSTQIAEILTGLGLPDVSAASLALTTQELEDLARGAQAVLTLQNTATATSDAALSAKQQLGTAPPAPQDMSDLQTAWDHWQAVADISVPQNAVTTETARLASAVAELPENWATLVSADLPARETLLDTARETVILTADLASARADFDARHADHLLAQAKRQADADSPSSVDTTVTQQARRLRDATWVSHRDTLSAETAGEFERAMHSDDDIHASFAAGTAAREQLATARRDENAALVLRDTAQARLDRLTQTQSDLRAQSATLATALGYPAQTSSAAFTERYAALMHAAQVAAQLTTARARFETLNDQLATRTKNLANAAKAVGITSTDSDLPNAVRKVLTLDDSLRQTWQTWTRANDGVTELNHKATQAAQDYDAAQDDLARLLATLPLAGYSAQDLIDTLPPLRNLQRLQSDHSKISLRITALERAVSQLRDSADRITALTGDPLSDPLTTIATARNRVATAQRMTAIRSDAQHRLTAEITTRKSAENAVKDAKTSLNSWFDGQSGDDLPPMTRIKLLAERDALRSTRVAHDSARKVARTGAQAALFDAELALLPDVTRAADVAQLLADTQDAREHARDAYRETTRLYSAAFDAADRSELATEQATLQEDLRAGARRAVVARLGVLAAKGALRRLASERRTTMLRDVEHAFVAITAPAWSSVDVWSEVEGEKLVGVQPDGTAVPVEMMSTGTMGQLYFALRVAGYRSFARDLGSLPMILDDIMETFDDGRARAALQLCADIGRSGQAIIFTHHAHLVDLARDTIPDVNLVEMPR